MSQLEFGQPLWFWALALIPLLVGIFIYNEQQRAKVLQKLVAARLAGNLAGTVSTGKRRLRFALLLFGLACVIVSLAQPRWGYTWQERKTRGRDVLIAIDVSRSMLANDLAPNRLTRAKLAAEDFIGQLGGDRVGLIAFAGTSFLQAPLTADHTAVLGSLHELDTDIIPRGGTNIAEAIRTAVEAFGKGESDNRALVIFTDGEELDADGIKVAKEQKEIARIYTVGVGSTEGTVIAVPGRTGDTDYVKDPQGQIVKSRLDEERLRAIAEAAGGFYLHLQNGPAEMRQLVRDGIGSMNEKDINAEFARQPIERYQWPLAAGMALLVGSMLVGERRKARLSARPVVTAWALAASLLFVAATGQAESPGELYEQGRYKEAQDAYGELLRSNPNSDRLAFNHGAAAYKNRDFKSALESFGKAVTSEDHQLRAKAEYNLGNTLFQQATTQKQPDVKTLESALSHFEQALKLDSADAHAQQNYDITKQLIEQLKQKPPESQKEQQKDKEKKKDQKDQKDQQQSKGGQDDKEQQDQQQSQGNQQDQQKDQKSGKEQEGQQANQQQSKEQQGKDGKQKEKDGGEGDKQKQEDAKGGKKEQSQDGQSEQDGKEGEQSDSEKMAEQQNRKLEGELKNNPVPGEESKEAQEQKEAAEEALAAAEGRMTESQAKALLDSLKSEDRNVRLWDSQDRRQRRERPLRDW